ncbi:cytochrome P450 [Coprinellus micaceus]|uniref:Cytochrome P450 n=1 Tax=Coprinellus micaceus TaxID=71717 RepID=A0A4Y7TEK9_COPMI|nr:cytochrome P450 [Coprinellus micaceus]
MIQELMGWDFNTAFMDYGPFWREHRKVFHQSLHPVAAKQYTPHITKTTHSLLKRFLNDPDPRKIMPHLRYMAGATILSIAYGIRTQQENDLYIKTAEDAVHSIAATAVPGAFLVDSIPLLRYVPAWLPGASFRRKACEWHKLARRMLEMPYAEVKRTISAGTAIHSIVSENLERIRARGKDKDPSEDVIKNVAGTLYGAASDTTVSAITSCIMGLLENPHILRKAQAELDSVVKTGHLPDLEDQSSLPYITALAKETLRWREMEGCRSDYTENEYNGYHIPAGAIVIPNAWAMLHDESVYEDPFMFNPDRFIDSATGKVDFSRARDPAHACWGFGRRICPGHYVAFSEVWLAIASLICVFDFEKAKVQKKNADGEMEEETAELTHEYVSALIVLRVHDSCWF